MGIALHDVSIEEGGGEMNADKILSLLSGSDYKNPIPLRVLREKACMAMEPLLELIEEMYAARSINKCIVSKHGVTQIMVWPTGVPEKVSFKQFSISPPAPLRTDNISPGLNAPTTKEPETRHMEQKSKSRIILETISERGSVSGKDLIRISGANTIKPFIRNHVDRGLIVITGGVANKTYALAPGVTPEMLLADGRRNGVVNSPEFEGIKTGKPNGLKSTNDTVSDEIESVLPITFNAVTHHVNDIVEKVITNRLPTKSRFRLARTSDGTLMLFGLSSDPIELDQEQTELLVKFVSPGVAANV